MHQWRPDIRLIPLLSRLDITRRNTTLTGIQVVRDTLVSIEDSIWVILEIVGSSAQPEGVELGRAEEDLLALGSILLVNLGSVVVGWVKDRLCLGSQVVVEVAPMGLVPHEGVHGKAAVGSDFAPLTAGTAVACLLIELSDGDLVSVQDRVEVNRDDVSSVEVSEREVIVANSIIGSGHPLNCAIVRHKIWFRSSL